jgi:hypothetical protein
MVNMQKHKAVARRACSLIDAGFMLDLLLNPEGGGNMFL